MLGRIPVEVFEAMGARTVEFGGEAFEEAEMYVREDEAKIRAAFRASHAGLDLEEILQARANRATRAH